MVGPLQAASARLAFVDENAIPAQKSTLISGPVLSHHVEEVRAKVSYQLFLFFVGYKFLKGSIKEKSPLSHAIRCNVCVVGAGPAGIMLA